MITNGHYYAVDGTPMHWVPKKDGSGNRPTTIADARKLNLLPSVTSILGVLAKPALQDWLIRNAVTAVVTAPDVPGESLDAKITRVLDTERQQDQESQIAMDRGTQIHDGLERLAKGEPVDPELLPWIEPAWNSLKSVGTVLASEKILVGEGYAGKTDLILENDFWTTIIDFKSTKRLPDKGAYPEHSMQASAYCKALKQDHPKQIRAMIVYISTINCGEFTGWECEDWESAYSFGFAPLVTHWQYIKGYTPTQ